MGDHPTRTAAPPPATTRLPAFDRWRDDEAVAALLVRLRDAMSVAERIEWTSAAPVPEVVVDHVVHLPPPAGGGDAGAEWRRRHEYGGLFWRRGPGFVTVRERRDGWDAAVYVLDEADLLRCVDTLLATVSHRCGTCDELTEWGLAMDLGADRRVFLPYRLRFPPVPFLGV